MDRKIHMVYYIKESYIRTEMVNRKVPLPYNDMNITCTQGTKVFCSLGSNVSKKLWKGMMVNVQESKGTL